MAIGGDQLDFDEFYSATVQRLVRQIYAFTGDLGDAQDVAQEAYARAWQRWGQVCGYDAPEAWVRTVGMRLAVSRWRKAQNAATAWRRHGPPRESAELNPDSVALVEALRQLPERQRAAVVLHYMADLSVEQVAMEMSCPVGSVKAWLSRGRKALAAQLTEPPTGPLPTLSRSDRS
ncbi:MAG: SigE family RNA polymerase sigma factor [Actinomycetota bacterium]|nr:SigE family RNA polymerase sigma factor [Actinomycetota bacterium]